MKNSKTVVLGASPNPSRYAYAAAQMLHARGHDFVPVGIKKGTVLDKPILDLRSLPSIDDVDTITLYVNAEHQKQWYEYLLSLVPRRIIFNPGAENPELYRLAANKGIECVNACTLVMISTGQY